MVMGVNTVSSVWIYSTENDKASLYGEEFFDLKQAKMYSTYKNIILDVQTKENTLFPLIITSGKISMECVMGKDSLGDLIKKN